MMDTSFFTPIVPLVPLQSIRSVDSVKGLEPLKPLGQQQKAAGTDFGQYLNSAISELTALQVDAAEKSALLVSGDIEDFHTPIIALEKASLALGLAVSLRNKVLDAYHEVMRMQI